MSVLGLWEKRRVRFAVRKGGYPAGTEGILVEVSPDGGFVKVDNPKPGLGEPFLRWEELERLPGDPPLPAERWHRS
jgi:hypothetical protein